MDSRLAADPIARQILETLSVLERAAGVRAHYRVLDPPPLTSTDPSAIQTVARVLGDWIGLRNAMFEIEIIEHDDPPRMFRIDPDQEVFAMELSSSALATPETALAAITRQVARAYLINSNIAASSVDPDKSSGSIADITTIFLGMGKLILNAPAAGNIALANNQPQLPEYQPLSPEYLAFTHRIICAMRGLDWGQHVSGLNSQALANLRKWDTYRDSVFSQALRNVLTASASHRPLMDAIEDNHLALARFDQLHRAFETTVLLPLQAEMAQYHQTCRDGTERLVSKEQDTYDPCLLYLNQLKRRMDLQRYADMLQVQQDHIVNRLRILTAGISDLNDRNLVRTDFSVSSPNRTHCPFDGTPIAFDNVSHDTRVKCPTCAYNFLATPGIPQINAIRAGSGKDRLIEDHAQDRQSVENGRSVENSSPIDSIPPVKPSRKKKINGAATLLCSGIILLPLSWIPMLGYILIRILNGQDAPLTPILGRIGLMGSGLGLFLVLIGTVGVVRNRFKKKDEARDLRVSSGDPG